MHAGQKSVKMGSLSPWLSSIGLSTVKHHDDSSNVATHPPSLRDLCSVQQPNGEAGDFPFERVF